jgi:hypothetical protein
MSDIEKLCKCLCTNGVKVYPHPKDRKVMAAGKIYTYTKAGIITRVEAV